MKIINPNTHAIYFQICSAGGNGTESIVQNDKTYLFSGGGGGGGSHIYATLKVNVDKYKLKYLDIQFNISNVQIIVNYTENLKITYTAVNGKNCESNPHYNYPYYGEGGLGGTFSVEINNKNLNLSDFGNHLGVNGPNGGGSGFNGTAGRYTSSGSGCMVNTEKPYGTPPFITNCSFVSQGGGKNNDPSGYGAGGTSRRKRYYISGDNISEKYRQGTPGIVFITES